MRHIAATLLRRLAPRQPLTSYFNCIHVTCDLAYAYDLIMTYDLLMNDLSDAQCRNCLCTVQVKFGIQLVCVSVESILRPTKHYNSRQFKICSFIALN